MATVINAKSDVQSDHEEYLFPALKPYYREPIVIAEASGVDVVDTEGRHYLDLFAGILTTSVGHCHPEVVSRVQEQVARLGHTSTLYLTENQVSFAKKLAGIAPGKLKKSFFTNSGTEAVETAIMAACIYTGRSEVVALRHAYSGRSLLTTNITAHASWRPLASHVPIKHALSPNRYRMPQSGGTEEEAAEFFARDLEEVIITTTNGKPAAFIAETIQGVGGYIVPPRGYFQRAAEIIRHYGGVLIIDEVQAGVGRTGEKWFGIEHWGVEPDIMVMAKGVASGFPVGVTITTDEIANAWTAKTLSTYGGNPISMAAAEATLDVMTRENVPALAKAQGDRLRAGLEVIASEYPWIGEVRGMGLMQALELVEDPQTKVPSPRLAGALLEAAKDEQLLIGLGGLHGQVIRVGPSLLITPEQIDDALERFARACRTTNALV